MDEGSTLLMAGLAKQIVAVVDDDPRVRESLESLIASAGLTVCVFSRAEDFLRGGHLAATGCLITDVNETIGKHHRKVKSWVILT